MSLNSEAILAAVESHALASGYFDRVNRHEAMNAPGLGLTAEIWVQRLGPARGTSGLAATSALLVLNVRLRKLATLNSDQIDPDMLAANDALVAAYSADFELGGLVREVDLLGEHGVPLQSVAGWLPQDGQMYRVYTIDLPVVVNDLWTQAA